MVHWWAKILSSVVKCFFLVSLGGSTGSGKGKCEGNHRHFAILDYLHVCCVVCNGIIVAIVAIRRGARLCFRVTQ